jgi:4-hydroxy-3-methylbut-2-en-1-yl diphosphate synthase IspG/GcpE
VRVGDVGIGGANPIRVQSMTTTDTQDTKGSVDQIERLVGVGCEIVRLTAPSIRDAENLREIQAEMARRGVRVPLVADIHFTPNAAMIAAEHVQKVRVNPGNFADKKKFEVREYDDRQYEDEIERVAVRFRPLVKRCKELGRALRIGTNAHIVGGLFCYGFSVVVWIMALSRVPVSQAYPLLSLGYVLNVGLAWWLLGELPNLQRTAGIGVILLGVVLVARS